jgi:DNA modification methylase
MLIRADARQLPIRSGIVQTVVTSPPYWGLRDYGTARWEGGDEECGHKKAGANKVFGNPAFNENRPSREQTDTVGFRENCGKCGAKRIDTQLGLEATPEAYVAQMVSVFREVWRVLRNDGTVWLNLGDSYATGAGRAFSPGGGAQGEKYRAMGAQVPDTKNPNSGISIFQPNRMPIPGLKPKDLIGIPWRVAFALQADGWWLRQDIIWSKPNPMPESVTDRPTKAHEYVFLLTKSKRYYYDQEAIRETANDGRYVSWHADSIRKRQDAGIDSRTAGNGFRNRRSVWEVATEPYAEAHFATFPRKLIEPMILAGSRLGDLVLDPFVGSGTTVHVARGLGRIGLGCDLKYQDLSAARIYGPLFASTINL